MVCAPPRLLLIQRFLSQPFNVAEVFTGSPGKIVPLKETIRGFKMIVDGECDALPEQAFYMVGRRFARAVPRVGIPMRTTWGASGPSRAVFSIT